jgi:hypothetical protein
LSGSTIGGWIGSSIAPGLDIAVTPIKEPAEPIGKQREPQTNQQLYYSIGTDLCLSRHTSTCSAINAALKIAPGPPSNVAVMKTKALLGLAAVGIALTMGSSAHAGVSFNISFDFPLPPPLRVVHVPAPPVCPPPVVVCPPRPVAVCPPPVAVYPRPVVVVRRPAIPVYERACSIPQCHVKKHRKHHHYHRHGLVVVGSR